MNWIKLFKNLKGVEFSVLIIDDASTVENNIFKVPQNFKSIKIIKMKMNPRDMRDVSPLESSIYRLMMILIILF